MDKCYCGAKSVDDKEIDFSKYDIGVGLKFCGKECLDNFLIDYGLEYWKDDNTAEKYSPEIREEEIDGEKKLVVEILFYDKDWNHYFSISNVNNSINRWGFNQGYIKQILKARKNEKKD